ncbi:MAG: glycosyltransferase [Bacteroidota bacterium]
MKSNYRSVYTAFDPYPSHKGSAVHIEKASGVLNDKFGNTLLLTLPRQTHKRVKRPIKHVQYDLEKSNFLNRALAYSAWVDEILQSQYHLQVGHFRDVWGGLPILKHPHITSVFEVNGLPSIELQNRYSYITKDTIQKIQKLEDECLQKTDLIVCPSETIKKHLITRNVSPNKIHVITNGAIIPKDYKKPSRLPDQYIVYFGALQPWQGVDVLIKAMQYLQDKPEIKLVICSAHKEKFSKVYQKLVNKLGLAEQVIWKHKLNKEKLFQIIQHAVCTVAPLTECSRNLEQGCSPLKIFESMACKAPIIASDLPVVREILEPGVDAKLVRPDRPAELARAIRLFVDYPGHREELAQQAFLKLNKMYTWDKIDAKLSAFYDKLVSLVYT